MQHDDVYDDDLDEVSDAPRHRRTRSRKRLEAHRGGTVLTLGILGLVICVICGIIAWVMGNEDLRKMREGRMDRSGESMTQAGKVCGMISVILAIVILFFWVVVGVGAKSQGAF